MKLAKARIDGRHVGLHVWNVITAWLERGAHAELQLSRSAISRGRRCRERLSGCRDGVRRRAINAGRVDAEVLVEGSRHVEAVGDEVDAVAAKTDRLHYAQVQ